MQLRPVLLLTFLVIPATALANGAMGYALEIFEFRAWVVYVVATVALEAWIIGRFFGHSWSKCFGLSFAFNATTAFCCAGGLWAPALHAMVVDGDPLLWTCELLIVFGLVSAVTEAILWRFFTRGSPEWRVFRRVALAHALGVPLALVILLSPGRPYPGYEAVANVWRFIHLRTQLRHVYDERTDENGKVRQFRDVLELEQQLDAMGGYGACLYPATYPRFATRDPRRHRFAVDINHRPSTDEVGWLIRVHEPYRTLEVDSTLGVKVEDNQGGSRSLP